jgi:hypothetical protein
MNFWAENIDIFWHVARAYKRGTLSIFLGAGVSRGCGLPLWPDLVRGLHLEVSRRSYPADEGYGTFDNPEGWGGLFHAVSKDQAEALQLLPLTVQSRYCKTRLRDDYIRSLRSVLYARPYHTS